MAAKPSPEWIAADWLASWRAGAAPAAEVEGLPCCLPRRAAGCTSVAVRFAAPVVGHNSASVAVRIAAPAAGSKSAARIASQAEARIADKVEAR